MFTAYQTGSVTELIRTWIILLVQQITRQGVMKHCYHHEPKQEKEKLKWRIAVTRYL